ncbi:polysaccharide biosynthesis protein [Rhodococcus sp. MS16]|uniref:lipopolysaccharide biosynthesis protein n=1 Tax=Rhodococcus sp. MS16 TaxID=2579941 RepID=UPI001561F8DE|nr:polysaccharide biosynthesis protein [Rhodococcus sp. MS16]
MSRLPTRRLSAGLESNAAALMLSSVATGALGLVYWAVAERFFSTAEVGRASAVISTATMLASVSCLSLGGAYQRFLPVAGRASTRLVLGGLALTAAVAVLLGCGFLLVNPTNERLFTNTTERVAFPMLVMTLAIYALTDPILTGLRLAKSVAAKNIALSVLKIVPIVALAGTGSTLALTGSWGVLAFGVTAVALVHILRTGVRGRKAIAPDLPPVRELWAFQGVFFTMTLVLTVTPLVLPLIVVSQLGAEQNAYFNVAWTMCSAVGLLRSGVGSSFIVEASSPDADRKALLRRLLRMLAVVTAVSAAGLAIGGPLVLYVISPDYFHAATTLVLVMALDSIAGAVVVVYFLLSQILRRLRLMLAVQCVIVVTTVSLALVLIPRLGLIGAGLATLSAQLVAIAVIAVPLRRAVVDFSATPGVAKSDPRHLNIQDLDIPEPDVLDSART